MPATPNPSVATSANPLTPEQLQQVSDANERVAKIRRAARVAGFNAWTIGVFAVLSLPFALFDFTTLVITIALFVIAYNESRGQRMLKQFEPRACRLLGWNQLGLMALLVGYCIWCLVDAFNGSDPLAEYPELSQLDLDIGPLIQQVSLAMYGGVIVGTLLFQGGNALYYFTRERILREYLEQTEPWIVALQKSSTPK